MIEQVNELEFVALFDRETEKLLECVKRQRMAILCMN